MHSSSMEFLATQQIVIVLIIVLVILAILLIIGIRKSYKLKKENERLDKMSENLAKEDDEYEDFTNGHMYQ